MVRLTVVAGKNEGDSTVVRQFPARLGRAAEDDLKLTDPGVWAGHGTLHCSVEDGVWIEARQEALAEVEVEVDDQPVKQAVLRDGSSIGLGSATVRFSLEEPRQSDQRWYGWAIAIGLAGLVLVELALILWL